MSKPLRKFWKIELLEPNDLVQDVKTKNLWFVVMDNQISRHGERWVHVIEPLINGRNRHLTEVSLPRISLRLIRRRNDPDSTRYDTFISTAIAIAFSLLRG